MAIYLEFEGIKGNVTAEGYEGQIAIMSVSFGVSRIVSMEPGSLTNRELSACNLSPVSLSKEADNSVTAIFKQATSGSAGALATLRFVRTGTDTVQEYMTMELTNSIVSGYSISASGDGAPMESIELSYSKIEISYTDYDETNKAGNPTRASYDLAIAKAG